MRQVFSTWCVVVALLLISGATSSISAQVASATPDPFIVQLTSSPASGSAVQFNSFAGDISANGRFVVVESNGDIATEKIPTKNPDGTINPNARNNEDGNYEIFLIDYAQRRIFQITNTTSVANPVASPSPTPTPSPSPSPTPSPAASPTPTPSPAPTPADPSLAKVLINNFAPMISLEPKLVNGKRVYVIVFSSNAPNPKNFDGTDSATLDADANNEIWIYEIPAVADVDLTSGADVPFVDLSAGTFTQITNTPASRASLPGSTGFSGFVADDNREPTVSDDGNRIAFVSTRDIVPNGNKDGNPEIFLFNRSTAAFAQLTNTQDTLTNGKLFSVFQTNPCLSSDGSVVAFLSNGNLSGDNNDDGNGHGNAEIYLANYNGATFSNLRQVTKTKDLTDQSSINLMHPGRRLSRGGTLLAFESLATDPKANGANVNFYGLFVYDVGANTFTEVGTRSTTTTDIIRFPTFTDYNASLQPSTLAFATFLNLKADGTVPTTASDGLNPNSIAQVFATQVPVTSANTFTRLTNDPGGSSFGGKRALTSNSRNRIALSIGGVELGGGNPDLSTEVFYLLQPADLTESPATLSFFTGVSNFPVPAPSPSPSASPTPTPSPSPSPSPTPTTALGLAPGELTIVRSTVDLAPSNTNSSGGSETKRSPALPVELKGVSVAVNGAAAGLYFVGKSPQQINFVMPIGLAASSTPANVVINNNGTVIRGQVQVVAAQPDIVTTTMDAGGNAVVFDVTNPLNRINKTGQPISVTSKDSTGADAPTILEIDLTGVRNATSVTVTISSTVITTTSILFVGPVTEMPGFDIINVTLPAALAGAGDVPIIVTATPTGAAFTSRAADTAPHVNISP